MSRYHLTSLAEADIDSAWLEIAMDNRDAAKRMLARFTDAFEKLAEYPKLGKTVTQVSRRLRKIVIAPYAIVYRIGKGEVVGTRVLHTARQWEDLL